MKDQIKIPESLSLRENISEGNMNRKEIKKQNGLISKAITLVKQVMNSCKATDISGVSAQMAFIILLALLPTLLFILLICSEFISGFDNLFLNIISFLMPKEGYDYIVTEINSVLKYVSKLRYLIIVSSALMGTLSAHTIITGLNKTYGFKPYASKKWEWFKSFLMLLTLCLFLAASVSGLVWTGFIVQHLAQSGIPLASDQIILFIAMGLSVILAMFLILLGGYVFAPQRRIKIRDAFPGALFALLGILVVFQIYVSILNRSANYLIVYGSLSGLFVMLTALYFLSLMINIGAKINVFLAHEN